ncbi:HipA N-terminal domain protein [Mucilaginibacter paludis DSM 18603]|uniref:HipA N-terminal domain protein n=2 Tax=Mucilaginibacter TaxID=423349 RepID=H1Y4L0_9SPHI|nr:HipA N-terminal domain protein [Mucilaginibacter paludis DSM 18603]
MVYYQDKLAGMIAETDEGYEFSYDADYLNVETAKPISLTMPLLKEKYTSKVLFAFFDGLIPEGWLLNLATEHWKVKRNDRFELLLLTCRDTIGAVTIIPENE